MNRAFAEVTDTTLGTVIEIEPCGASAAVYFSGPSQWVIDGCFYTVWGIIGSLIVPLTMPTALSLSTTQPEVSLVHGIGGCDSVFVTINGPLPSVPTKPLKIAIATWGS